MHSFKSERRWIPLLHDSKSSTTIPSREESVEYKQPKIGFRNANHKRLCVSGRNVHFFGYNPTSFLMRRKNIVMIQSVYLIPCPYIIMKNFKITNTSNKWD